jgi:hypothetical protein
MRPPRRHIQSPNSHCDPPPDGGSAKAAFPRGRLKGPDDSIVKEHSNRSAQQSRGTPTERLGNLLRRWSTGFKAQVIVVPDTEVSINVESHFRHGCAETGIKFDAFALIQ